MGDAKVDEHMANTYTLKSLKALDKWKNTSGGKKPKLIPQQPGKKYDVDKQKYVPTQHAIVKDAIRRGTAKKVHHSAPGGKFIEDRSNL